MIILFPSLTELCSFLKFGNSLIVPHWFRLPAKWEDGAGIQSLQATSVYEFGASWGAQNKRALSQSANLNHSWTAHHSATRAPHKHQVLRNSQVFPPLPVSEPMSQRLVLFSRLWSRRCGFVSSACRLALQTAVTPTCMRKPSPSKWCKARRTAPHPAAHTVSDNTAPHGRWVVSALQRAQSSTWVVSLLTLLFFFSPVHLPSRSVRRRRMCTGCSWRWSQAVSRLLFTTAAHGPLWGHTEICKCVFKQTSCCAIVFYMS